MQLTTHEAAQKLAQMRQAKLKQSIREPVSGALQKPLPYKHPLIGMPVSAPKMQNDPEPVSVSEIPHEETQNETPIEASPEPEPIKPRYHPEGRVRTCGQEPGYPGCGQLMPIQAHGLCKVCLRKNPKEREAHKARNRAYYERKKAKGEVKMRKIGICGEQPEYPGCGRKMKLHAFGLCATCYNNTKMRQAVDEQLRSLAGQILPAKSEQVSLLPIVEPSHASEATLIVRIPIRAILEKMGAEELREIVLSSVGQ